MKTIWKFPLSVTDFQKIDMPYGAEVLTVQRQGDQACVWAMVDTTEEKTPRGFWIFGTGNPIDPDVLDGHLGRYVGTFQAMSGMLVWHVFEHDF